MTYGCAGSGNQWSFDITKSCTLVKEHTEFVCTTAPGVGQDLVFQVIIAGQTSSTSIKRITLPTVSYKEPFILSLERNTERSNPALLQGGVTFGGFNYRLGNFYFLFFGAAAALFFLFFLALIFLLSHRLTPSESFLLFFFFLPLLLRMMAHLSDSRYKLWCRGEESRTNFYAAWYNTIYS